MKNVVSIESFFIFGDVILEVKGLPPFQSAAGPSA